MPPLTRSPWTMGCGRCSRVSAPRSWRAACTRLAPSFKTESPAPSCSRPWTGRWEKHWPSLRPGYKDQSAEAHEQPDHVARGELLPVADAADDHQHERGCDVRDHRSEADLPPGSVGEQDGEFHSHDRHS